MVSVIILNWNGEKLLQEFLPAVIANTDPQLARVVVADNGSTDGSLSLLRTRFPDVDILPFDKNYGFAGGYNRAIEMIDGEYAVLLNSDVAPAEGWIRPLVEYMEAHPECGGCQPKILSYRHPELFEYAGACGGFIDKNGYPYCRGRILDVCEEDRGQYDQPMEVFWATGAALMVRTAVYAAVGGLDEAFFAHMEEIDLCWRIQLAGWTLAVVPQSRVYHLGGASLAAGNPRKTYLNFRNNLLMMYKNLPDGKRGWLLFRRRLIDTLAWAKYMATLDFKNANAILRAHRDFRRMQRAYTTHPSINLLPSAPNILISYYLLGRRHYSDLPGVTERRL